MNAPVGTAPLVPQLPAIGRSWRRLAIASIALAHALGAALLLFGASLAGLAVILASHALYWWGALRPNSRLFGPVVSSFDTPRREVWLTIDDGPSTDTAGILDLLDAHGARATFFLVGQRALAHPDAVQAILARGHTIGNHTQDHPAAWFWAALPKQMAEQIGAAQSNLTRLCGTAPRYFRAVAGMANVFVAPQLQRHGLTMIGWSARGYDSIRADPERVTRSLLRDLRPGAILLLHEGAKHGASIAILARLLAGLDAAGLRCVLPDQAPEALRSATTNQLLNGVLPQSGVNFAVSPASRNSASKASRLG